MSIKDPDVSSHLQAVLRFFSIRDRSRAETLLYLNKRIKSENKEQIIVQIIKYLDDHHLLDDQRFTEAWLEAKLRQGQGPLKIQMALTLRGVDRSLISRVLSSISMEQWVDAAIVLLHKKASHFRGLSDQEKRHKAYKLLLSQGFVSSSLRAAIDRWAREAVK